MGFFLIVAPPSFFRDSFPGGATIIGILLSSHIYEVLENIFLFYFRLADWQAEVFLKDGLIGLVFRFWRE